MVIEVQENQGFYSCMYGKVHPNIIEVKAQMFERRVANLQQAFFISLTNNENKDKIEVSVGQLKVGKFTYPQAIAVKHL